MTPDVNLNIIAAQTAGMVGADLENLVNESAILATRRNKRTIGMSEFVESKSARVMAGPGARGRVLDAEEIAAWSPITKPAIRIVMEELKHSEGVGKITIVSRGQALGYVMPLPEENRNLRSRAPPPRCGTLAGLLAGRVAEELIFDEPSTSAAK